MRAACSSGAPHRAAAAVLVCATAACAMQDGPGPLALDEAQRSAEALTAAERTELERLSGYAEDDLMLAGGAAVLGAVVFGVISQDWGGAALGGVYGGVLGATFAQDNGAYETAYRQALAEGRTESEAVATAVAAAEDAARRSRQVAAEARRRADADLDAGPDASALRAARARAILIDGLAASVESDADRLRRMARQRSWNDAPLEAAARRLDAAAREIGADGSAVAARLAASAPPEAG